MAVLKRLIGLGRSFVMRYLGLEYWACRCIAVMCSSFIGFAVTGVTDVIERYIAVRCNPVYGVRYGL